MPLINDLIDRIHSRYNSNYHFDRLDQTVKIFFTELCDLLDEKFQAQDSADCEHIQDCGYFIQKGGSACENCSHNR